MGIYRSISDTKAIQAAGWELYMKPYPQKKISELTELATKMSKLVRSGDYIQVSKGQGTILQYPRTRKGSEK